MKIYIAGKITGEPVNECLSKFLSANYEIMGSHVLYEKGIIKIERETDDFISYKSPNIIIPLFLKGIYFGITHQYAMAICLAELETCDAIYMLSDWKDSKGAQMEHKRAQELGLEILYENDLSI